MLHTTQRSTVLVFKQKDRPEKQKEIRGEKQFQSLAAFRVMTVEYVAERETVGQWEQEHQNQEKGRIRDCGRL